MCIGSREIADADIAELRTRGITHVLNMAVECANYHEGEDEGSPRLEYLHCPCTDKADDNMVPFLENIVAFVHAARLQRGCVLVHCSSGISRSSSAVLAYLVARGLPAHDLPAAHADTPASSSKGDSRSSRELHAERGASLLEAFTWLKERRPIASPHPVYMDQLCTFESSHRGNVFSKLPRVSLSLSLSPRASGRRRPSLFPPSFLLSTHERSHGRVRERGVSSVSLSQRESKSPLAGQHQPLHLPQQPLRIPRKPRRWDPRSAKIHGFLGIRGFLGRDADGSHTGLRTPELYQGLRATPRHGRKSRHQRAI